MFDHLNNWIASSEKAKQHVTPRLLVHHQKLEANIQKMASFASHHQVELRPHFKTHKTREIVELQLRHGAVGVTVAKVSEAEALVHAWNEKEYAHNQPLSVLMAYPLVNEKNMDRATKLMAQANIIFMVDSQEHIDMLQAQAKKHKDTFSVTLKVNAGLNRCGVQPDINAVLPLVRRITDASNLSLTGIMTHAGHAYGASSPEKVQEIGLYEGEMMVQLGEAIEKSLSLPPFSISVGATPTVYVSGAVEGVTEIRPGNYVFYDRTQVNLGSARWEDCSLRVLSTVVSHPAPNRWVIDAGAKTLALDQGAHGQSGLDGYGAIVKHPQLSITRLSEEHGIIEGEASVSLQPGDFIEIIPNHACPVVNLARELQIISDQSVHAENAGSQNWKVIGSGCSY